MKHEPNDVSGVRGVEGFAHRFQPGEKADAPVLLLLHGTGGNENDLLPLGRALLPGAALLSPRGKVLENGMPRFFRRLAEGVFDEADLRQRTHELADFVAQAGRHYGFAAGKVIAVGYSNGANIAGAMLLLRPEVLSGAILLRPMVPLVPEDLPPLRGMPVLIASGLQDPIVPVAHAHALVTLLERAGAAVTFGPENTGHGLTETGIEAARKWLSEVHL